MCVCVCVCLSYNYRPEEGLRYYFVLMIIMSARHLRTLNPIRIALASQLELHTARTHNNLHSVINSVICAQSHNMAHHEPEPHATHIHTHTHAHTHTHTHTHTHIHTHTHTHAHAHTHTHTPHTHIHHTHYVSVYSLSLLGVWEKFWRRGT